MSEIENEEIVSFIRCKEELFDNGKTSVEYYYKPNSNILFITFDSVNILREHEPFGFKFLSTLDVDILAFRKIEEQGYSDFSYEAFYDIVKDILPKYKRKVAYGFSLGAYATLYYTSRIDCEIFAIAPRIPAHPIYGTKEKNKLVFNHDLGLRFNDNIEPIIAYDPQNELDNQYFKNEVEPNFPNLNSIKSEYAGHKLTQYYVQMGVLKKMVYDVYKGDIPTYDKKLRFNSAQYLSSLAEACLKRKKNKWAYDISEKALQLKKKDKRANLVKYKLELEEAKKHLNSVIIHAKYAKLEVNVLKDLKEINKNLQDIKGLWKLLWIKKYRFHMVE